MTSSPTQTSDRLRRTRAFASNAPRRPLPPWFAAALVAGALLIGAAPTRADDDSFSTNARLLASVRNEDIGGVERALRDGAAVNSRNRLGESALVIALKKNRADLAQLLLNAGADVNEGALNGIMPLMAAAYARSSLAVRIRRRPTESARMR